MTDRPTLVRPATLADRDAVLALLRVQFDEHAIALGDAPLGRALERAIVDPAVCTVLVATRDDRIVGVAVLSSTWTLEHGGAAAWLDELYVEPAERGRGIGRQLLAAASTAIADWGAASIDLEVDAAHERAAHLYQREGFTPLARRRWVWKAKP